MSENWPLLISDPREANVFPGCELVRDPDENTVETVPGFDKGLCLKHQRLFRLFVKVERKSISSYLW